MDIDSKQAESILSEEIDLSTHEEILEQIEKKKRKKVQFNEDDITCTEQTSVVSEVINDPKNTNVDDDKEKKDLKIYGIIEFIISIIYISSRILFNIMDYLSTWIIRSPGILTRVLYNPVIKKIEFKKISEIIRKCSYDNGLFYASKLPYPLFVVITYLVPKKIVNLIHKWCYNFIQKIDKLSIRLNYRYEQVLTRGNFKLKYERFNKSTTQKDTIKGYSYMKQLFLYVISVFYNINQYFYVQVKKPKEKHVEPLKEKVPEKIVIEKVIEIVPTTQSTVDSAEIVQEDKSLPLKRKIKAVKKKLSQIEEIESKKQNGDNLDKDQLCKIDRKESLINELNELDAQLALLSV